MAWFSGLQSKLDIIDSLNADVIEQTFLRPVIEVVLAHSWYAKCYPMIYLAFKVGSGLSSEL